MYKVYLSRSCNPCFNLALEEYLVRHAGPSDQILFLWQNQNTVVIGRNQNPWKECDLEALDRQKGRLIRRLSGGGAVYHDLGNLNFTFISAFTEEKIKENIGLIIKALDCNGIEAVFSGKNDILAQGYKVSGNAFFVEDEILCHHGTLLVDSDLKRLGQILTVSQKKLQSKGIDSVKSRVINMKELNRELSIEGLRTDLTDMFLPQGPDSFIYWMDEEEIGDHHVCLEAVHELKKKYESWEWNFGESPEFNLQLSHRFPWGETDLYMLVKDGKIFKIKVFTDALDINLPEKLEAKLLDLKFDEKRLIELIAIIGSSRFATSEKP
ncbi:lipoate--protein ligase [Sinanaerobacter chloroacetimidivorans]|uniref:lipoate--protein ligase n=1 Tax=Sinanaerobacter chloroacetimidivorans TaxID=2818044 RepID=A0A8J7W2X9_9FIRM|nr:lipoate--protein ligase [Sinanaerobacter chloroacetimidivorans]MBR0599909.1 lipoate--protein ligase [Sinanaerobacter chloroacetimidivorans]